MNKFVGKWKIVKMEQWDVEYIDLVEPGQFHFNSDATGEFMFGTVSGDIDGRFDKQSNPDRIDYSWEGTDEMDPVCGRGWFELVEEDQLYGRIFIHNGDDSWVRAEKK